MLPLDLHVLGLPPAFNLSHDQTLQFKILMQSWIQFKNPAQLNRIFGYLYKLPAFKSAEPVLLPK